MEKKKPLNYRLLTGMIACYYKTNEEGKILNREVLIEILMDIREQYCKVTGQQVDEKTWLNALRYMEEEGFVKIIKECKDSFTINKDELYSAVWLINQKYQYE